jgi:transposase
VLEGNVPTRRCRSELGGGGYRAVQAEILAAYDAAAEGEKGPLLRREGLYSSHIVAWRRARNAGGFGGVAGPAAAGCARGADRALERENRHLEQELAKARFVVEVQAKLHALWRRSSRASSPSAGRGRGRRRGRGRATDRRPGSVPGLGSRTGRLLPAAPDQFRTGAARTRGAASTVPASRRRDKEDLSCSASLVQCERLLGYLGRIVAC